MADALRARWAGGIARLDWFLTRYWDAVEADLAFRGIDLLAAFQACRVRYLLNLVLALPRHSLTGEAMSQDDELVESLMNQRADDDESRSPSALRMAEFSPEVEATFAVVDRLGDVVSGLVGLGGKKPPRIAPVKRPPTAWERVSNRRDLEKHQALVRRVLPNG